MSDLGETVKAMGLDNVPPYYFVSHASADNDQIRPIIEALLDADIPIWFDKPEKISLSIDRFVGKVPVGLDWSQVLDVALERARGCIWFPTKNYLASEECKRERDLAIFLRNSKGYDYKNIAVLASRDAIGLLDHRSSPIQGAEIFSEYQEGGFEVRADHLQSLENFCSELRRDLEGFVKAKQGREAKYAFGRSKGVSETESSTETKSQRRTSSVPFRVDRNPQRQIIRNAYEDWRDAIETAQDSVTENPVYPPVIICHGEDEDMSRRFTKVTLVERLIKENGNDYFFWGKESASELTPNWPATVSSDQNSFNNEFARELLDDFQASDARRGRGSRQDRFAAALKQNKTTRLAVSRINLSASDKGKTPFEEVRKKINAWIGFWNAFPFDLANHATFFTIIPILDIVYPSEAEQASGFLWRKPTPVKLREMMNDPSVAQALTPDASKISVKVLQKFGPIGETAIEEWIFQDNDELFDRMPQSEQEALLIDLKKVVKDVPDGVSMRQWSEQSAQRLNQAFTSG